MPAINNIDSFACYPDVAGSLAGKYFTFLTRSGEYGMPPQVSYLPWYSIINQVNEKSTFTAIADVGNSLAGKYFTFDTTAGKYYAWYRIDQGGAGEVSQFTAVDDINGSLAGKYFTFNTSDVAYYIWYRVNQIGRSAETTFTAVADVSRSLAGKYFTFNTPTDSYYVYYKVHAPGIQEVSTFTTIRDTSGSLAGKYFKFHTETTSYYVWYRVSGSGTNPSPGGTGIVVDVPTDAFANTIATNTVAALTSIPGISASIGSLPNKFLITVTDNINVTDSTVNTSGFTLDSIVQGTAPAGRGEETTFTAVADVGSDLRGKYFTFNGPSTSYYTYYTVDGISAGSGEESTFTSIADSGGSLAGKYFTFETESGSYYVWFTVYTVGTDPAPGGTGIQIDIPQDATDIEITNIILTNLSTPEITVTPGLLSNQFVVTNLYPLNVTNATGGDSGFTVVIVDGIPDPVNTNPSLIPKTKVIVDISTGDSAAIVSSKTTTILNSILPTSIDIDLTKFTITVSNHMILPNATIGTSGFSVSIVDGISDTIGDDPYLIGKTGFDVILNENESIQQVVTKTLALNIPGVSLDPVVGHSDQFNILNNDHGVVNDSSIGNSGFSISRVSGIPDTLGVDPSILNRTSILVDININDTSDLVISSTCAISAPSVVFEIDPVVSNKFTITAEEYINTVDSSIGTSEFSLNIIQGIPALVGSDPLVSGRVSISIDAPVNSTSAIIASSAVAGISAASLSEITVEIDPLNPSKFIITSATPGTVEDSTIGTSGFALDIVQGIDEILGVVPPATSATGIPIEIQVPIDSTALVIAEATVNAITAVPDIQCIAAQDQIMFTIEQRNPGSVNTTAGNTGFAFQITTLGEFPPPPDPGEPQTPASAGWMIGSIAVPIPSEVQDLADSLSALTDTIDPILQAAVALLDIAKTFMLGLSDLFASLVGVIIAEIETFVNDLFATGFYFLFVNPFEVGIRSTATRDKLALLNSQLAQARANYQVAVKEHNTISKALLKQEIDALEGRIDLLKFSSFNVDANGFPLMTPAEAIDHAVGSFDDTGDARRPVLSETAEVTAIGIMMTSPELSTFSSLLNTVFDICSISHLSDLSMKVDGYLKSSEAAAPTTTIQGLIFTNTSRHVVNISYVKGGTAGNERVVVVDSTSLFTAGGSEDIKVFIGDGPADEEYSYVSDIIKALKGKTSSITVTRSGEDYLEPMVPMMTTLDSTKKLSPTTPPDWQSLKANDIEMLANVQDSMLDALATLRGWLIVPDDIITDLIDMMKAKIQVLQDISDKLREIANSFNFANGMYVFNVPPTIGGTKVLKEKLRTQIVAPGEKSLFELNTKYTAMILIVGTHLTLTPVDNIRKLIT